MARLVREYRKILSIAIAQTQTEQASSPSMTAFTTQWACRNSAISDTSLDAIGSADCATSAGFIGGILSTLYLIEHDLSGKPVRILRIMLSQIFRERMAAGSTAARQARRYAPAREPHWCRMGPVQSQGPDSSANVSKRGLFARHYVPNQTLIMVNARLPKGNLAAGNQGNPGG